MDQMITTGFSFEGYTISKYKGVVSGDVVIGNIGMFPKSSNVLNKETKYASVMAEARDAATNLMINRSAALGGNAIIGVSFSVTTYPNNLIGITATGTSVCAEK